MRNCVSHAIFVRVQKCLEQHVGECWMLVNYPEFWPSILQFDGARVHRKFRGHLGDRMVDCDQRSTINYE